MMGRGSQTDMLSQNTGGGTAALSNVLSLAILCDIVLFLS